MQALLPTLLLLAFSGCASTDSSHCQQVSGLVEGCCGCTAEATSALNARAILPVLHSLSTSTYFRYYKATLGTESCPFGFADGMCQREECEVDSCCASDLPSCLQGGQPPSSSVARSQGGPVWDESIGEGGGSSGGAQFAEVGVWTEQAGEGQEEYYDLVASYEAFTNYGLGDDVDRNETRVIWQLIYEQPCLSEEGGGGSSSSSSSASSGGTCLEERVFYRLLSGLHASINTHLSLTSSSAGPAQRSPASALLTHDAAHYKPNLPMYIARVGNSTERTSNLYFAYIFVARAITRAAAILRELQPSTGSPAEDAAIRGLLEQLLVHTADPEVGLGQGFDESQLFVGSGEEGSSSSSSSGLPSLLVRYRERYRNISRILNCVGCSRCQLWGKMQFLGLGTACKVLFAEAEARERGGAALGAPPATVHLSRNEVVALINVFHRLSISVAAVDAMQQLEREAAGSAGSCEGGGAGSSTSTSTSSTSTKAATATAPAAQAEEAVQGGMPELLGEGQWGQAVGAAVASTLAKGVAATAAAGLLTYLLVFHEGRWCGRGMALLAKKK